MKRIAVLVVFCLVSTIAFSQVDYGVRVGYNISNLDFEPAPTFTNKHRNGFAFGGFIDYQFSEKFSIMPELMYSAEGAKAKALRANYIKMPITFRFHFGEFSIGIGPEASLKTWSYEDNFANLLFNGVGSVKYDISKRFFIDARYTYGFMNILDDELAFESKNSCIQIGFGIHVN